MSISVKEENPITELLDELDKKGIESIKKVLKENREGTIAISNMISSKNIEQQQIEVLDKLGKDCISIIKNGANEFKKKTGREMTYYEMREAYG